MNDKPARATQRAQRMNSDPSWRAYVDAFRADTLPVIAKSAISLSFGGTYDAKTFNVLQATELGAILLLGKPLVVLEEPGQTSPPGLKRAADVVLSDWVGGRRDRARLKAALTELGAELDDLVVDGDAND